MNKHKHRYDEKEKKYNSKILGKSKNVQIWRKSQKPVEYDEKMLKIVQNFKPC